MLIYLCTSKSGGALALSRVPVISLLCEVDFNIVQSVTQPDNCALYCDWSPTIFVLCTYVIHSKHLCLQYHATIHFNLPTFMQFVHADKLVILNLSDCNRVTSACSLSGKVIHNVGTIVSGNWTTLRLGTSELTTSETDKVRIKQSPWLHPFAHISCVKIWNIQDFTINL